MINNFKPIPSITPRENLWENGTWQFAVPTITPATGIHYQDIVLSGNGSLTLTNAKANSLNYLKLYGGCEQRNLPSGYTQVEYIEADGTQYIDINVSGNVTFLGTAQSTTDAPATSQVLFANGGAQAGRWFGVQSPGAGTGFAKKWGLGATATASTSIDGTTKVDFEITFSDVDGQYGTVNNETLTRTTSIPTQTDWIILAGNNIGQYGFIGKIWKLQAVQNNVLVRDLIPCKNSSNVVGMYDTVSNTFFTNAGTGTFTAGPVAVLSPDNPMDIVCNNGVVKLSPNLLNPATVTTGAFISNTGAIVTGDYGSSYGHSDYIKIENGKSYIKSNISASSVAFYNSSKTFVERENVTSFTATYDGYVRINYTLTDTNMQFEQGSTATTYRPYGQTYVDGTTEKVEVHTKNLFDEQWNRNTGTSTSQATWGQVVSANGWSTSSLIPVKAGQQYTVSYNTTVQIYVFYYEADGTMQQSYDTVSGTNKKTFTVPSGAVNVRLQINKSTEAQITALETQLELGSTATTYEAYYNGGSATAQDLYAVGTYKDVQSVLDGTVTRNIGIKVLDGTEDWVFATNLLNYMYSLPMSDLYAEATSVTSNRSTPYCTHFNRSTSWIQGNSREGKVQAYQPTTGDAILGLGYGTPSSANLTNFKTWLSTQYAQGTPVVVVYPLATATTESVTGQALTTKSGTNIVEITQASINNLPLELSYKGVV